MRYFLSVVCFVVGAILPLYAEADVRAQLQENLERAVPVSNTSLSLRFSRMRYYPPNDTVYEEPSFWDDLFTSYAYAKEKALAVYLFNMYVSAQTYNIKQPTLLTLNFLGVLDGLSFKNVPLEPADALEFYEDHQQEVQQQIERFFLQSPLGKYPRNTAFETACIRALQKSPVRGKKAGYFKPATNRLNAQIPHADAELLSAAWVIAKQNMVLKAVLFDVAEAFPNNFDTPLAHNSSQMNHWYSWVKDECYYSSYFVGKQLIREYKRHPKDWGFLRLYLLTARPKTGTYLQPAQGNRFTLADGKKATKWQYHTVILAVTNSTPHTYTPVVLDSFLGGEKLLTLDEWLSRFSANTVFFAEPFVRSKTIENAIKEPTEVDSQNRILINGVRYSPTPLEK